MTTIPTDLPRTLGELRRSAFSEEHIANRSVKDELRTNLIARLRGREPLFPGIVGYDDTVVPQLVNARLRRTSSQQAVVPMKLCFARRVHASV